MSEDMCRQLLKVARAHLMTGDTPVAAKVLDSARERFSDRPDFLLKAAKILIKCDAPNAALTCFEQVLSVEPENKTALYQRFKLACQIADFPRAQEAFDAVENVGARKEDVPFQVNASLQWAQRLEEVGQSEIASTVLQNAVTRFPDQVPPLVKLSELALRHGEPETALEAARQARKLAPWAVSAVLAEVSSLEKLGHLEDAYELLKSLVIHKKVSPRIYTRLIDLAGKMQDIPAISTFVEQGLRAFPENPVILEFLVRRSMGSATPPPIGAVLRKLEGKLPTPRFERLRADLLLQTGDYATLLAQERLTKPHRRPDQVIRIIRALLGLMRLELALRYSRFCLRRWPADMRLAQVVATAFSKAGRAGQAVILFESLCSDGQKTGADTHYAYLAHLCFEDGQLERALRYYRAAARVKRPVGHRRMVQYIRSLASAGDVENTRDLIADFFATANKTNKQVRKTFSGQLAGEIYLELVTDNSALNRRLTPGEMVGHAQLIQDFPQSNIAGMRFMRNWLQTGRPPGINRSKTSNGTSPLIPRIIHQYWNDPVPPDAIISMTESWRGMPNARHRLWNRQSALTRLRSDFGPSWARAFLLANNPAEEADFLRLCLLAKDGGVYADADDILTGSPDRLIDNGSGLVVFMEPPKSNLGNNFLAARPGHPAIILAARIACQELLARSNETTWSKTGPGLLTRAVALYLARQSKAGESSDVLVLTKEQIVGDIAMHNPVQYKRGRNYWQQNSGLMLAEAFFDVLRQTIESGDQHAAA